MKKVLKALIVVLLLSISFIFGMSFQKVKIAERYVQEYDPASDLDCVIYDYVVNGIGCSSNPLNTGPWTK